MKEIDAAVAALERGEVVVYPTETVYGLGVDATNEAALARLIGLKTRPDDKPISLLIADRRMLDQVTGHVSRLAERLISRWWPGPLTLVVAARPGVSDLLTAGTGTVGVRISSHVLATTLVTRLGRPVTAPSANPAGGAPASSVDKARAYFGNEVTVYVNGGELSGGSVSTVVDVTGSAPRIVREGVIATEELLRAAAGKAA